MNFFIACAVVALCAFVLHLVWEMLHIPLYRGYEKLGHGWRLTLMATMGDSMYTLFVLALVSLLKGDSAWLMSPSLWDYIGLGILGFFIALFVEYKALALKRWGYTRSMPILFGVGVSPLLQMTLLLPLSVFLATYILPVL